MFAGFFFKVLSWLSGGVLNRVLTYLERKDNTATERDKVKATVLRTAIVAEMDARQNAREIRLATAGFWEMRLLTVLIALPFVVHLNLVALDTCFGFGWGVSKFPAPFDEWEGAILLSFFGVYAGLGAVQSVSAAIGRRMTK